jgi:starch phosphorylase
MELINGKYSNGDMNMFREIYDSLLMNKDGKADQYFILADFKAYDKARADIVEAYQDEKRWAKMAILNMASSGKFTSDRTIQQYEDDIWHQKAIRVTV